MIYSDEQMMSIICANIGVELNKEQREFAMGFDTPTESLSDPGTGKSTATAIGIIFAQLQRKIPGDKINAMSFTREATSELSAKYSAFCKECNIKPTASFRTFHSLCYSIVKESMKNVDIRKGTNYERDVPLIHKYLVDIDKSYETMPMIKVRNILLAINRLNSKLCYSEFKVKEAYPFKKIDIPYEHFTQLRKKWFVMGMMTHKIVEGDLPLYALYFLMDDEKLREKYRSMYKIMIIDEFQDLTMLHMKIISLIAETLIAIGDIKQQIYGFNGACSTIVQEFRKYYPNHRSIRLLQSYRCKNEIAEFSTKLELPNDRSITPFKGNGTGGTINIAKSSELSLQDIVKNIKDQNLNTEKSTGKDTMFVFRNNYSIAPVIEELYRQKVEFRSKKYARVFEIEVFKDLCAIVDLAIYDSDPDKLKYVGKLFPEFKQDFQVNTCPILAAIKMSKQGLLDVMYAFSQDSSIHILGVLRRIKKAYLEDAPAKELFALALQLYDNYIIEGKWWKLEHEYEFYEGLVGPIIEKDYDKMIEEENDKYNIAMRNHTLGIGVRCLTMHSAKGLEAHDVFILDCEMNLMPSAKNMDNFIEEGCQYEAAITLRNERNLLYVGVTRAKQNVHIIYNEELTDLVATPMDTKYGYLDEFYETNSEEIGDDTQAFLSLFKL